MILSPWASGQQEVGVALGGYHIIVMSLTVLHPYTYWFPANWNKSWPNEGRIHEVVEGQKVPDKEH